LAKLEVDGGESAQIGEQGVGGDAEEIAGFTGIGG